MMLRSTRSALPDLDALAPADSVVGRLDPRVRIIVAASFSLVVSLINSAAALGLALLLALVCAGLARLRPAVTVRRLLPLNGFLLLAAIVLPWSVPGTPIGSLGPIVFSAEGAALAARLAIKGNAIVLAVIALLATIDIITIGHALWHLHVPDKLTHLLLFTARYVEVLEREYHRLHTAMRLRAFRPGLNWHTYRTYGHLVGMLLVRSVIRAERVALAMKCRGFHGKFYMLEHFAFARCDAAFAGLAALSLASLACVAAFC